jgi:hypothetical protein
MPGSPRLGRGAARRQPKKKLGEKQRAVAVDLYRQKNHTTDEICYLHSLESYLKHLLYKPALLCAFNGIDDFQNTLWITHDLVTLSQGAARILRKLFPHNKEMETFGKCSGPRRSSPKSILARFHFDIR